MGTWLWFAWSSLSTIMVVSIRTIEIRKINLSSSDSLLALHLPVENNNNFLESPMFCKDQFVPWGPRVFMEVKTSANFSFGSQPEIEILFLEHQVGDAGSGDFEPNNNEALMME